MIISKFDLFLTKIPLVRPQRMATGTSENQENVIIKMYSDEDIVGVGEVPHMLGTSLMGESQQTVKVVLENHILPNLIGENPFEIERLHSVMDSSIRANPRAKSGVSLALYDIVGKALGVPVYTILGGKVRDSVPLSWSIPITSYENGVREARQKIESGWKILKIKLGRADPADDVEMVKRIRDAVGEGVQIRVDANQAYDVKTAIRVGRSIDRYAIEFYEQPVSAESLDSLAEVSRATAVPLMADESLVTLQNAVAILSRDAAQFLSIYVSKSGGLLNDKKIAHLAESYGSECYLGGALESTIGACAGLQLAASTPNLSLGCELYGQYILKEDIGCKLIDFRDGELVVPTDPGLGLEIDEDKLERYTTDYSSVEI